MPDAQTLLDEIARRGADDDARREARLLLAHALGRDPGWLRAHDDEPLDDGDVAAFRALWTRRQAGEPVAYLTGRRGFWTLDLETSPAVLIPRPETELLVEAALARLAPDAALDVVDLGTGSGAVALAIAEARPRCRVTATDVSLDALAIMRRNAERHGIASVEAIAGRWFEPLADRRFHLIVSNPPYIADDDPHLRQGDLRFEPQDALASGPDGLDAIREIAAGAGAHLRPGGWLLVEHGWEQATAVRERFEAAGLTAVASLRDLSGHERVTLGRQPNPTTP